MNPLLDQLKDIDGLDPVQLWPLAIGWWLVIAISIILGAALIIFLAYWIAFKRSWKSDALKKLDKLEKNLNDKNAKTTLISLSEFLRRIALQRFQRKECAGLVGEEWLKWLSEHDPKQFEWEKEGKLLIDGPYAPHDASLPSGQIKELIKAVRQWVR